MKRILNINTLFIGLIFLLFTACGDLTSEIEWETNKVPPMLIVEGEVTTDFKFQQVLLKHTEEYFYNKPLHGVSGAIVSVSDGQRNYRFAEDADSAGRYISLERFSGIPGRSYQLEVQLDDPIDNRDIFEASAALPSPFPIDTVVCSIFENLEAMEDEDSILLVLGLVSSTPLEGMQYFSLDITHKGKRLTDTITDKILFNNEFYDDQIAFYVSATYNLPVGDTIDIEISSVTEQYFDFVIGVWSVSYPVDPFGFSGPQANVIGNVSDGRALGFFNARSIVRTKAVIQDFR